MSVWHKVTATLVLGLLALPAGAARGAGHHGGGHRGGGHRPAAHRGWGGRGYRHARRPVGHRPVQRWRTPSRSPSTRPVHSRLPARRVGPSPSLYAPAPFHTASVPARTPAARSPFTKRLADSRPAPPPVWATPAGQAWIDRWISVAMGKLNAHNGSADFNSRKPWSINRYGVLEGNPSGGPTSVHAPDDFAQYGYNKYWWMWAHYVAVPDPVNDGGIMWPYPEWNRAGVPFLQDFVEGGLAGRADRARTSRHQDRQAPGHADRRPAITPQQALDNIKRTYGRFIPPDRFDNYCNLSNVQVLDEAGFNEKYKLVFGREPVRGGENAYGFWSGATAYVRQGTEGRGTVQHELLHAASNPEFGTQIGHNLDEATTEYFTRPLTAQAGINRDDCPYYTEGRVAVIQALANLVGPDVVARAYFGDGEAPVQKLIQAVDKARGPGTWDKFVRLAQDGLYAEAAKLLRPARR